MPSQVLQSPEFLSIIFSHADQHNNASCAIVCKHWLEPALNQLWRHVGEPLNFFKLLAPMRITNTVDGTPRWLFSRFVLPSDWTRFELYADRIRSLNYSDPEIGHPQRALIDPSVFAEVARTRPTIVILPKLRRLKWKSKLLSEAILFMSGSVTHLEVNIEAPFIAGEGFLEPRAFLLEAAARLPNLTLLNIKASFSVGHVQDALVHLLGSSLKLFTIVLPRYWLSSTIISKLASSPALKIIQWEYLNQGVGDRKDVENFRVSPHPGAFPALLDFSLEVRLHAAIELIESPFFPDRLTNFFVDALELASPSETQRFFASCSTKFRSLTLLHLDLHSFPPTKTSGPPITLETLQPVLSCPNLTDFTFLHDEPLAITDNDVEIMASRLPSLVILLLNHQPTIISTPLMTLAALPHFAQHCPHLEQLGLYLDATAPAPSVLDPEPFAQLHALHVGTSPIHDVDDVALFLSRVCPINAFDISVGIGWDSAVSRLLELKVQGEIIERNSVWTGVSACLPMLVNMRAEERSRSRQLELELERLRTRNQLLEANSLGNSTE